MPKLSAGLLLYRIGDGVVEVLLAHPGGPFWARKDEGAWSIPKGEYVEGEDPWTVAQREFQEELGKTPPDGPRIDFDPVKQPGGKVVTAFAVRGDLDLDGTFSNTFTLGVAEGIRKRQGLSRGRPRGLVSGRAGAVEAAEGSATAARPPGGCSRSRRTGRVSIALMVSARPWIRHPDRVREIFVVIAQMPDQVRDLPVGDGPMVSNARDAAQCIVGVVPGGVHLADDRVFGPGDGGQRSHRGAHTVAAVVVPHRLQCSRRVG